jgi:FAD/FMN-containing dehydrogenase
MIPSSMVSASLSPSSQDIMRIATEIKMLSDAMGAGLLMHDRDGLLPKIMGTNYDVTRKFKSLLDPENIMSPGIIFLQ